MYPHERSLVEDYADRPFVLLGVNSDSKEKLLAAIQRENITWRSWWDGGNTRGPIARQWNVLSWPTIFVIDHEGIIRYRDLRGDRLETAIRILVAEIENTPAET